MIVNKLKSEVMRRIYFIFFLKKTFSPLALELMGLFLSALVIASSVSLSNILANTLHTLQSQNMTNIAEYYFVAFRDTEGVVQGTIVVSLILIFFVAKKPLKNLFMSVYSMRRARAHI